MKKAATLLILSAIACMALPADRFGALNMETRMRLLKEFDKDGDGMLNAEEREAANRALNENPDLRDEFVKEVFRRFDRNGNGKLDKSELEAFLTSWDSGEFEEKESLADITVEAMREDREGTEMKTRLLMMRVYKKYGADADGFLTDEGYARMVQDPEVRAYVKMKINSMNPKLLETDPDKADPSYDHIPKERLEYHQAFFNVFDANGDGNVDDGEIDQSIKNSTIRELLPKRGW